MQKWIDDQRRIIKAYIGNEYNEILSIDPTFSVTFVDGELDTSKFLEHIKKIYGNKVTECRSHVESLLNDAHLLNEKSSLLQCENSELLIEYANLDFLSSQEHKDWNLIFKISENEINKHCAIVKELDIKIRQYTQYINQIIDLIKILI